jgi:gliding motility-associated lipoprotein GldD
MSVMKHRRAISNQPSAIGKNRIWKDHSLAFCTWFIAVCSLAACNSDFVQKERGYFKIELPPKKYQLFNRSDFPYTFEYPVYGTIVRDSTFFDEQTENPYWVNIVFPQFDGELHLSYKEIGRHQFDTLVNDAFKLAYKQHTSIASGIQPVRFEISDSVSGVYFTLKGNAATANQFFATDSTTHFLRGSLYFNVPPNEDSLRPVNNFLREDMQHLINTLKWR